MGGDLGYALVVYADLHILQAKYAMTVEPIQLRHLATPKKKNKLKRCPD